MTSCDEPRRGLLPREIPRGNTRRQSATPGTRPRLHRCRTRRDRGRAWRALPRAPGVRRREWTQARGMVGARTPTRWPRPTTLGVEQKNVEARIVPGGKTRNSVREVPLTARALAALDLIPPRLGTRLLFAAPEGGPLNLDNFRRREWAPAVEATGVRKPATPYDLRDTPSPRMRSMRA